ncbi:Imm21 family immunity protein [Kitasatospora sp. NPDC004669]|uniref:Imm21 family immunity protein n=1 Tax=Kitasatospora sp. NPDC004669 TaxID=3154555 RepID=UPI0033A709F3
MEPNEPEWVDPLIGPLVLVPEAAPDARTGGCGRGPRPGRRGRRVPGAPGRRRGAGAGAGSRRGVDATAPRALQLAEWEDELDWEVTGRAAHPFDAHWTAEESAAGGRLRFDLPAGRHLVRAAFVEPAPETTLVLVRLFERADVGRRP